MPAERLQLLGGAYTAPSLIASAQRAINLFPENNLKSATPPVDVSHYDRPGLGFMSLPPNPGIGRGLFRTSTGAGGTDQGDLYAVLGQQVYFIDQDFAWHPIGALLTPAGSPVFLADNGRQAVLVDGSNIGYIIDINSRVLTQIADVNFLGADRNGFVDTFLVFNQPRTPNWYSSLSNSTAFSALDFGTKTASADNIVAIVVCHRYVWLLGVLKSEVWFNAGLAGFPFQSSPQNIVEQGCAARYSPAAIGSKLFWLSQSPEGDRMVMAGINMEARRVSTHAIEAEFKRYRRVDDAIGATYQQNGHEFYKLHFPSADKTWVLDDITGMWHERAFTDSNGMFHRERDAFSAFAYGLNLGLDHVNGTLYRYDVDLFADQILPTDASSVYGGSPLVRVRSMPHLQAESGQMTDYKFFMADMEVGTGVGTQNMGRYANPWSPGWSSGFGPNSYLERPLVSLRWSDDRGFTYGNKVLMPMGASGEYNVAPTWNDCGTARDRVFELSWSTPQRSALNGAFILAEPYGE